MPAIITEIRYRNGPNFPPNGDYVEVRVPAGSDVSGISVDVYNANGTVRSSNDLDGLTPATVGGFDYYLISARINRFGAVSLVEDGTVSLFASFDGTVTATEGAAAGPPAQTSVQVGSNGRDDTSSLSSSDGQSFFVNPNPDPGAPTCFRAGSLILTECGYRPVETLTPGDLVMTSGGPKPLLRVLGRSFSAKQLLSMPKLCPVRIRAGALGKGIPRRDLWVTRQHRMLLRSKVAMRMFGQDEVLIPAIRLTALPGIQVDLTPQPVSYWHLVLDAHEILDAEGALSESLFTGPEAMKMLSPEAREEILTIFPELAEPETAPVPARFIPDARRQKRLLARHRRNDRPVWS